jgi:hypothetical protein
MAASRPSLVPELIEERTRSTERRRPSHRDAHRSASRSPSIDRCSMPGLVPLMHWQPGVAALWEWHGSLFRAHPGGVTLIEKSGGLRRLGLIGCVKEKRSHPSKARDLYVSTLFVGRRRYVEFACDLWWVLSAAHGLVDPDSCLEPYAFTLKDQSRARRRAWSSSVLAAIDRQVVSRPGDIFEIHAGAEYRDYGLVEGLQARGCVVVVPTAHMPIGKQLQFYSQAPGPRDG